MQELKDIGFILPKEEEKEAPKAYKEIYDVIVIGGGPGGLTAVVYLARKKLDTLLVSKDIGGQVILTSDIENYMGYQYITGQELIRKFQKQVSQFPIDISINEEVENLESKDKKISVLTKSGKNFTGKAVIIASGKRSRPLDVPGEKEFVGRGVSYCATCDAPLFAGKDVAVIGGGDSALEAIIDLAKVECNIYAIHRKSYWDAEPILIERVERLESVKRFFGYVIEEIKGDRSVSSVSIKSQDGKKREELSVAGVFIEIGLVPNSEFVKGIVALNDIGEILANCACETNAPGIFAAGDVTSVPEKQIVVAAGEGAKAALSAYRFLLKSK